MARRLDHPDHLKLVELGTQAHLAAADTARAALATASLGVRRTNIRKGLDAVPLKLLTRQAS